MLGFENLYIVDGSTDARCVSFLRYARDILGANVLFSKANLNEMEYYLTIIAKNISGSSDLIIKMDTDEFLVVYDDRTNSLIPDVPSFLSGFANDPKHPLHISGDSRFGYLQHSIPSEEICKQNIYSTPDKFLLGDISFIGDGAYAYFKCVYNSRLPFRKKWNKSNRRIINLGGHAHHVPLGNWTKFGIIHYHYRCVEIEVENCKRVLERHNFIDPVVTDAKQVLETLIKLLKCPSTPEDFCSTCTAESLSPFVSFHKALMYGRWLSCPNTFKKEYYPVGPKGMFNADLVKTMEDCHEKFDL